MKKNSLLFLASFVFIFAFYSCENTTPAVDSNETTAVANDNAVVKAEPANPAFNYTLQNKRVGDFKVGGSIASIAKEKGYVIEKRSVMRGGEEEPFYIISGEEEPLLKITPSYNMDAGEFEDKIGNIVVLSNRYKLDNGVGIGTTMEEFQKIYPDAKLWHTYISNMFVLESEQVPAQFLLDEADYTGAKEKLTGERTGLKASDFKQGSEITEIRLY